MDRLDIDVAYALRDIELRVALTVSAETVAVVGASGSGKTTLLRLVAGLVRPSDGSITLGDQTWFDRSAGIDLRPEARRVGYVPQDYALFPHLTVAGNVRFAARRARPDLLERLGIAELADAHPADLSGGERQRVAIARALAREPRVLLLDEPFGALDVVTRRNVRTELGDLLADLALPALLVTHAFDDAAALGARCAVIDGGSVVQCDDPATVLAHPSAAAVAALVGANVIDGTATSAAAGSEVTIAGGGRLGSTGTLTGPVRVAIHPWELRLVPAATAGLRDTVVEVRTDGPRVIVRTTRLAIDVPAGSPVPGVGEEAGLAADPDAVRLFPALSK
jgi:molybdate transport system ATP-binding protein